MECNIVRLIIFFSVSEIASFGDVAFVKQDLLCYRVVTYARLHYLKYTLQMVLQCMYSNHSLPTRDIHLTSA